MGHYSDTSLGNARTKTVQKMFNRDKVEIGTATVAQKKHTILMTHQMATKVEQHPSIFDELLFVDIRATHEAARTRGRHNLI